MYISEFVGTLLLISAVAFAKSPLLVVAAFAIASTIGKHLNPAVTVFAWMSGQVSKMNAVYLVLAQILAGIVVGIFYGFK
jgi:glycerol uptake facilitator-like aquaporin